MAKITVLATDIHVVSVNNEDYICITDMLKAKDGDFFISDWLRNRNTLEYLGIWERLYNPDFNYGEQASRIYAGEADVLNVAMFGVTALEWRDAHPDTSLSPRTRPGRYIIMGGRKITNVKSFITNYICFYLPAFFMSPFRDSSLPSVHRHSLPFLFHR